MISGLFGELLGTDFPVAADEVDMSRAAALPTVISGKLFLLYLTLAIGFWQANVVEIFVKLPRVEGEGRVGGAEISD